MNFDHWKDVQEPVVEPATPASASITRRVGSRRPKARDPKSTGSILIDRAYTKVPSGSRKGPAKSEVYFSSAPSTSGSGMPPGETSSATPPRHFVASDPAPDMDLAFADIDREIA